MAIRFDGGGAFAQDSDEKGSFAVVVIVLIVVLIVATNIGGSVLGWNDAYVRQDINVVPSAKTGGVDLRINQTTTMNKMYSLMERPLLAR